MSGTVRAGVIFGLAAVGAVIGASLLQLLVPIPCIGLLSVIALGLAAGYTAAKTTHATRDQRISRGLTAGALAGLIVLVGGGLGIFLVSLLPAYQAQIQAGVSQAFQNNPDLSGSGINPNDFATLLSGGAGIIGGICGGLFNFLIMLICGLLGSLFWKGTAAPAYVPAGGALPGQSYDNQPYNPSYGNQPPSNQPYGNPPYNPPPSQEGGARVYDPNDPNRPPQ